METNLQQNEVIVQIPLSELRGFLNHPFKVREDEAMQEIVDRVESYGVFAPAIVRPREDGGYEIVAGHRHRHACEIAELPAMGGLL